MKDKKRTLILLSILGALLAYTVPNVILNDKGSSDTVSSSSTANNNNKNTTNNNKDAEANSKDDTNKIIKNGSTANASKNQKNISKDKLEIDTLLNNSYSLKTANNGINPFKNIATNNNASVNKSNIPPTTNINNSDNNNIPNTIPMNIDRVDNNFSAMPQNTPQNTPEKKESVMTLRAIAQTNNKIIAVIEADGKRTSAFIGTSIGDYTVTDIDSEHVYLQEDNTGETRTLDLSK